MTWLTPLQWINTRQTSNFTFFTSHTSFSNILVIQDNNQRLLIFSTQFLFIHIFTELRKHNPLEIHFKRRKRQPKSTVQSSLSIHFDILTDVKWTFQRLHQQQIKSCQSSQLPFRNTRTFLSDCVMDDHPCLVKPLNFHAKLVFSFQIAVALKQLNRCQIQFDCFYWLYRHSFTVNSNSLPVKKTKQFLITVNFLFTLTEPTE